MRAGRGWAALALLLAFGSLVAWPLDHELLDWQPQRGLAQAWRAWTAVFVHYSALHLAANLAGALLVALLGHAARMPRRGVVAWCLAWPATQWGLWLQPELAHYGGLSGVLHAGVAVVAVHLIAVGTRSQRLVAAAMALGLVLKVVGEAPWAAVLRHPAGWDIAVAPMAHASGAAAGAICAAAVEIAARLRPTIVR